MNSGSTSKVVSVKVRTKYFVVAGLLSFLFVGCGQQSSSLVNVDDSIQVNETLPRGTFYYPLALAVQDWTMPDEVPYLVDEFLKMGISSIKPGLVINEFLRNNNAYGSSVWYEVCPEIYTLADIVYYGTGKVPNMSWVQSNGNYEENVASPRFSFNYTVAVLDDNSMTSESITDGFNRYVAAHGDTCEFVSNMWFMSDEERDKCISDFSPGFDSNCLRSATKTVAPGAWGHMISKLVYSNTVSPSLFSATPSIPYTTSNDGYRRDVMARKLYVLPDSNDIFEVAVQMSTSDLKVTDDYWNEVVLGLTDKFFSYVYSTLLDQKLTLNVG